MNIKAILSDMDGTLIDFNGIYDKSILPLIRSLQKNNVQFSVATGKPFLGETAQIIRELDLSPLHVVNGGGMIINWRTGETPWYRPISALSIRWIVDYMSVLGLVFSMETKGCVYILDTLPASRYWREVPIKKCFKNALPQEVLKILVFASANKMNEENIFIHIKNIEKECKDVELMRFQIRKYFGMDITSEESTKHTAVLEYAKILGISPSEMVAIGDGHNDYPLFTACGYKIAMGNAPNELKEIADKVVNTVENGGMKEALRHIISIIG